jgi:hypothetical protein
MATKKTVAKKATKKPAKAPVKKATKKVEVDVLVGDVFLDQDPRRQPERRVRVLEISTKAGAATVQNAGGGPKVSVRLDRLRPIGAKKGFRLVERGGRSMVERRSVVPDDSSPQDDAGAPQAPPTESGESQVLAHEADLQVEDPTLPALDESNDGSVTVEAADAVESPVDEAALDDAAVAAPRSEETTPAPEGMN